MGYYSDVAFVARKKDWDKFCMEQKLTDTPSWCSHKDEWGKFAVRDASDGSSNEEYVVGSITCKWYEGSPSIDTFLTWLRGLADYEYARAGEEAGDVEIEQLGDVPCWLSVYSGVNCEVL